MGLCEGRYLTITESSPELSTGDYIKGSAIRVKANGWLECKSLLCESKVILSLLASKLESRPSI